VLTTVVDETSMICTHIAREIQGANLAPAYEGAEQPA
jgi:hypothetical protein